MPRHIPLIFRKVYLFGLSALAAILLRQRRPVGGFDPVHYLSMLRNNSDFRKFDDGLKLTLDCSPDVRDRIRARLQRAAEDGVVRFGLHEQDAVMVTCIVPSVVRDDHVHFVDGAAGGYTQAAANMAAAFDSRQTGPGHPRGAPADVRPTSDFGKSTGLRVVAFQTAFTDIGPQTVQAQLAGLHRAFDEREGHQIFQ